MESPAGAGGERGSSESSPSTSSRDLKPRLKRRNSLSHTQKLSAEILRRLRIASDVEDTRDRDEIFRWLIADLAGEVESGEAASTLVQKREGGKGGRFYQAVAQSLVRDDTLVPELLVEFERLWHHTKVTLIFALVFYKFLVVSLPASSDLWKKRDKYNNVLLTGMKHLFWSDLHTESKRFTALFGFLSDEVVLADAKVSAEAESECAKLVARFSLYYRGPPYTGEVISAFPANVGSIQVGVLDFFVKEIVKLMRNLKVESVTILYLSSLVQLNSFLPFSALSIESTARVQEMLFTLSQPGGPYYAPKSVRVAARKTFGKIYPNGHVLRGVFKVFTSLLHPAYSINAVLANVWLMIKIFTSRLWESLWLGSYATSL